MTLLNAACLLHTEHKKSTHLLKHFRFKSAVSLKSEILKTCPVEKVSKASVQKEVKENPKSTLTELAGVFSLGSTNVIHVCAAFVFVVFLNFFNH